jgi:hypothetical protein
VISPEGCASILWKTSERAAEAAEALGITAHRLKALGLIDKIVNEPVGGAHRDMPWMARSSSGRWRRLRQTATSSPRNCCSAATSACVPTAASPTPRSAEPARARRVAVAVQRWPRLHRAAALHAAPARPLGIEVRRAACAPRPEPEADAWLARCERRAGAGVRGFDAFGATPEKRTAWPGESVEAWARAGRYAALAEMAKARGGRRIVLLAHHRRDQAETWLLQALRGGGPRACPAMPRESNATADLGAALAGPVARGAIEAYVRRHRIRHVEDPAMPTPALRAAGCASRSGRRSPGLPGCETSA